METEDDELNLEQEEEQSIEPDKISQEPTVEPEIETQEVFTIDQSEELPREYTTGFNHAYVLASAEPVLLEDIVRGINPSNVYFEGFFAGKEQWQQEQVKVKEEELSQLRNKGRDRSNELER